MPKKSKVPADPLAFIRRCIQEKRIFWTYHVNMRFGQRPITRDLILGAADSFEVIEQYPQDKYLPSYLIRAEQAGLVFHVQIATDIVGNNVRIVTAYIPDAAKWDADFRTRRQKP